MKLIAIIVIILINSVCFGQYAGTVGRITDFDSTITYGDFKINDKTHWVWIDDRWVEIDGGVTAELSDNELSEIMKRTEEKATLSIPKIAFIDDQIPTTYQFDIEELFKAKEISFSYQGNNVQCFNAKALATYFYMSMEGKK